MIKSAVTIALVPQIKSGPWIYWENLEESMRKASALGFNGIELFTSSGNAIQVSMLRTLLDKFKLELAAIGTGAGKILHGLTLTDIESTVRKRAIEFVKEMMNFGAEFGTPAIIGSMQGNISQNNTHSNAITMMVEALETLDEHASKLGVKLIYEPLNRYETNLINTLEDAVQMIEYNKLKNIRLLADLFHMNIEESNPAENLQSNIRHIGHVHFADSNRRPVGHGHINMYEIAATLINSGYNGYVSAEAIPWPCPDSAAQKTIESFDKFFKNDTKIK